MSRGEQIEPYEPLGKSIKSGEYFDRALAWYNHRYIGPYVQRSIFAVIATFAILSVLLAFFALQSAFPIVKDIPFPIGISSLSGKIVRILPLSKDGTPAPDAALAGFYVTEYLKAREGYKVEKLERNYKVVRAMSDNNVYQQFYQAVDVSNPLSPVVIYGKDGTRNITIDSLELHDSSGGKVSKETKPAAAVINFTVNSITQSGVVEKSTYQANISFTYKDIVVNQETQKYTAPEFLVTGYEIKQLGS